jgi:hypothetical protein
LVGPPARVCIGAAAENGHFGATVIVFSITVESAWVQRDMRHPWGSAGYTPDRY